MKKGIIAILVALAIAVALPAGALAAEADALPGPGMTPASSLYFMETWMQRLNLAFTFGPEARLQKALRYAGEKLAEMETVSEQNQTANMAQAAGQYRYYLNVASRNVRLAAAGDSGTAERVARMMASHIAVMTRNQDCGDEDSRQVRERTRMQAEECQESSVRALAGQNPEAALALNLALMEQQRERAQNMIGQAGPEDIQEALRQCERISAMNQEMAAAGEQLGLGPEAQKTLQQALATQAGMVNQIRNQFQSGSGGTVDAPVENQVQERQGATAAGR